MTAFNSTTNSTFSLVDAIARGSRYIDPSLEYIVACWKCNFTVPSKAESGVFLKFRTLAMIFVMFMFGFIFVMSMAYSYKFRDKNKFRGAIFTVMLFFVSYFTIKSYVFGVSCVMPEVMLEGWNTTQCIKDYI
jgi:hypothetical protein